MQPNLVCLFVPFDGLVPHAHTLIEVCLVGEVRGVQVSSGIPVFNCIHRNRIYVAKLLGIVHDIRLIQIPKFDMVNFSAQRERERQTRGKGRGEWHLPVVI